MSDSSTYHPALDDPNAYVLYRYHPSLPAAIIFVIAFALTTFWHCWQCARTRTWYFIPLIIGGFFEWVGYIGRALSHKDQWALGPFIQQSLLLLVAPALFAASVYMVLGRIILLTDGEQHSMIRQKWLTKIFVTGDVISFMVQAGGAGIMASGSESGMHTGETVVVVGLFIQLAFFGFFMFVGSLFYKRIIRQPTSKSIDDSMPWRKHFWVLMTVSMLIFVRSVFRVIEYLMGNNGYLLRHEVFLYIFDAVLMLGVMVLFNVVHPSEITRMLKERNERETDMEEIRERYIEQESV
ncbi:RTA-like protein [Macrophomina phaseolina MS6]|uniref:RTA-like protein n=2 Tax=Macrophomina phaseolina TaxID=35725 RepID=K2S5K6_MACPH|nr:RTA-like protein [Macrophomina phaseolina MS6]KAH7064835.1 RTA1 like protein-domain-containing protein [Macrophomina phaseolina]